jgi:hypothetical protein
VWILWEVEVTLVEDGPVPGWEREGVRVLWVKLYCEESRPCSSLLCIVPQYGRLAAIYGLLAFNHCACLRNARRISYTTSNCGLSLHRNKQKQTAKKTKLR